MGFKMRMIRKTGTVFMLCALGLTLMAQTQTPLQIAIENTPALTGKIKIDGQDWFVVKKENGYAFLVSVYAPILPVGTEFSSSSGTDYGSSPIRSALNTLYSNVYNYNHLKTIAVVPDLGIYSAQNAISQPTATMAYTNPSAHVLFVPSYQDVVAWKTAAATNLFITANYHGPQSNINGYNWWTRTPSTSPGQVWYVSVTSGGIFSAGLPSYSTNAVVAGIWVKTSAGNAAPLSLPATTKLQSDIQGTPLNGKISIDGQKWIVAKRAVPASNGENYVFLISCNSYIRPWSPFNATATNTNYSASNLRSELNAFYAIPYNYSSLKTIAVVPDLGNLNAQTENDVSIYTPTMANTITTDILFVPSRKDLTDWCGTGGNILNSSVFSSANFPYRWWTRTPRTASGGTDVWHLAVQPNVLDYTPANATNIAIGVGIWVRTSAITYSPTHTVYGTVFPFVQTEISDFDNQFETNVSLYEMPPTTIFDKIGYIRKRNPIQTVRASYYDCLVDEVIIGAPKDPGRMGHPNNPGLPIRWGDIGAIFEDSDDAPPTLTETEKCSLDHIGKYRFENLAAGSYVIEISRKGFLTRYGVITVEGDDYLGHRELLAGDVNGDLMITEKDLSTIRTKVSTFDNRLYNSAFDLNGNQFIDISDIDIIRFNIGAYCTIYQEAYDLVTNLYAE